MQADFSVELGHDDPVLELPWPSDDPSVRYYDLKSFPGLVRQIPEAVAYPELGALLACVNGSGSPLETAKCDAWASHDISPEEEIFGFDQKFVSYIDLVFVDESVRYSFEKHEKFAKNLCHLLGHAPDLPATIELIIRRCYYHQSEDGGHDELGKWRVDSEERSAKEKAADEKGLEEKGTEEKAINQKKSATHEIPAIEMLKDFLPAAQNALNNPTSKVLTSSMTDALKAPISYVADRSTSNASDATNRPTSKVLNGSIPDTPNAHVLNVSNNSISNAAKALISGGADRSTSNAPNSPIPNVPNTPISDGPNIHASIAFNATIDATISGFYITVYATGFGDTNPSSYRQWTVSIALLQHALMQLNGSEI